MLVHMKILIEVKQPPRRFLKISVLFFQEQPFYNFPGGSIYSSNRHVFSRRVYNVLRTDTNFPGRFVEKTCFFSRRVYLFVEQTLLSRYLIEHIRIFQNNLYFLIEQISIFQEPLFSHQTLSRKPYLVLEHILFSRRPL